MAAAEGEPPVRTVLITGGSGLVGTILRHHWGGAAAAGARPRYRLILADLVSPAVPLAQHEAFSGPRGPCCHSRPSSAVIYTWMDMYM
jgi:hypothetical protein